MIRHAGAPDLQAVQAFLACHTATSMFLLGNLLAHGLEDTDHPYATEIHLGPTSGPIRAVFGRTRSGMLLCQAPDHDAPWAAFAKALRGKTVIGMSGASDQVGQMWAALQLPGAAVRVDHQEPLFERCLSNVPPFGDQCTVLRKVTPDDRDLLIAWFSAYLCDTGLAETPAKAMSEALERSETAMDGGPLWLLCKEETPVAMAGLNARTTDTVQLGSVFVPEQLRNQGFGRAVTAALLALVRQAFGTRKAILFSNNAAASAAYKAVGFTQVGLYRIVVLHAPVVVGDPAWH